MEITVDQNDFFCIMPHNDSVDLLRDLFQGTLIKSARVFMQNVFPSREIFFNPRFRKNPRRFPVTVQKRRNAVSVDAGQSRRHLPNHLFINITAVGTSVLLH